MFFFFPFLEIEIQDSAFQLWNRELSYTNCVKHNSPCLSFITGRLEFKSRLKSYELNYSPHVSFFMLVLASAVVSWVGIIIQSSFLCFYDRWMSQGPKASWQSPWHITTCQERLALLSIGNKSASQISKNNLKRKLSSTEENGIIADA